jgi:NADH dehydrogenase FAD-containing subunit
MSCFTEKRANTRRSWPLDHPICKLSKSRIDVEADLTVPGLTGVYAVGGFANIGDNDGSPLPQLASVAEQSG